MDHKAPPPLTYERNHDLGNQKVIFNPVGQYATNINFVQAEIQIPYKHIPKQIQQARSTIQAARDKANNSSNFRLFTMRCSPMKIGKTPHF